MAHRPSPVHYVADGDAVRTACNVHLFGYSGRRAPVASTNPAHVTCGACEAALLEGLTLEESTAS